MSMKASVRSMNDSERRFGRLLPRLLLLALAWGCEGTHTGNPSLPDGADFVRSELERDRSPEVSEDERAQLGSDNRAFALELYAQLAAGAGTDNVVLSPYSLSVGLAMTYAGSAGNTHEELAMVGHFELPEPELHQAFNDASLQLEQRQAPEVHGNGVEHQGATLRIANAAFAGEGTPFEADYLDTLAESYDAGMYRVDFMADPDRARMTINDWIAEQTDERLANFLPASAVDSSTRLLLANTVHFRANWSTVFSPDSTTSATFHGRSGDTTVEMMSAPGFQYPYLQGDGFQATELALTPDSVRMVFVLPDEGRFDEVEAALDAEMLAGIRAGLATTPVRLQLPRFAFDGAYDVVPALEALGAGSAFGPDADFSRMSTEPLFLSSVRHGAFISVSEEGVEAGAVSTFEGSSGTPPPPVYLTLDRPFLFVIEDLPTGQILFVGRLNDPR